MSEVMERESTELVDLPPKETALAIYSSVGGLDPLIEQIRAKVAGTVYDMATAKGRDECRSDAAKVAKSKTAIERLGKELSAQYKEIPKKIDAERKRAFEELEALQKQVRQPLTEWEQAEEARIQQHQAGIDWFLLCIDRVRDLNAADLRATIAGVEGRVVDESFEEFEAEARRVKARALEAMGAHLAVCEKHEAEQAELARLRAESEARAKRDAEERIAREAAEAATKAAEAKAQQERDAAAKREADAKAAQAQAEQEVKDAVERQKQAEALAEAEKLAAAERATQAAEAARLAEVKRQADEREAEAAAQRRREADIAHKTKLMGEAKQALMSMNITEDLARAIVLKIGRGEVPNITINF